MALSEKRFVRRAWLPALALTLLTTLIVLPPTRWLVAQQMKAEFRPHYNIAETPYDADREQAIIRAHAADADLQIAAALLSPVPARQMQSEWRIAQLQPLATRFPDNAKIYAHLLRYMTMGRIHLNRVEQDELTGNTKPKAKDTVPVPTAQQFADFDEWAAQGERIDSDNVYFPFMRALGLFAQHKDEDALAAIKRAGIAAHYRDYSMEEDTDAEKLLAAAYGPFSALAHLGRAAQILSPHYAQMRAVTRLTIYFAMRAEQQGHTEEGIALRNSIMRVGEKLRAQSHSLIGSLVGIACAQIASSRPGGASAFKPLPDSATRAERDARSREHLEQYVAFLTQNGHEHDVLNVRTQYDLGQRTKDFCRRTVDYSLFEARRWTPLGGLWFTSQVVLANLSILLVLGFGAWITGCFRLPQTQRKFWFLYVGVTGLPLVFWIHNCIIPGIRLPILSFASLFNSGENTVSTRLPFAVVAIIGVAVLIVPLCTEIALNIASRVARVPKGVGVPRGYRGVTVPIACVLVLLYCGLVGATAVEEHRVQHELNRMVQHEGRYLAERSGQQWP